MIGALKITLAVPTKITFKKSRARAGFFQLRDVFNRRPALQMKRMIVRYNTN